ncbi:MAG: hypothetical protein KQI35_07725 [Bacteroidetes bacterium]|nr:hypothetical protein [Bacteroidota bacterium]
MPDLSHTQIVLFEEIKTKLPENESFVHVIAELLGLSYDSAYRRIRGEKTISLEELYTLCTHFGISVDSLFDIRSGKIVFNSMAIEPGKVSTKEWLQNILLNIQQIQQAREKSIIYAAKDAPFFHYFHIPELASFKMFFWEKTLFQFPGYQGKKFSLKESHDELQDIGRKILMTYSKLPVTEIWNEDTFYIMLRQIEYYWISGLFENKDDIMILFDRLKDWIEHLQMQAELGFQFLYGTEPQGVEENFKLYENEVVLNDNTVLVSTSHSTMSFLTYNVINLLSTTDPVFCEKINFFLQGLIKKSTLISSSAAKVRRRFFNQLLKQLLRFREKIEFNQE